MVRIAAARRGVLAIRRVAAERRSYASSSSACAASNSDEVLQADAVIIGGGSLGASTLYHLAERGVTNAILLESNQLTAGTTWHSAGMLWSLRPTDTDIELSAHTKYMCKKLEEETEIVSWSENGGLFIACNQERLNEYRRMSEMGEYYGIDSHVLSSAEIRDVHPLMSPDDTYGAIYSPTDGTIDPTGIVNAYAKAAKTRGAQIFENARVVGIDVSNVTTNAGREKRQVNAVKLADGRVIHTKTIVNCAGAWAGKVANMVGSQIPLLPMKHAMVVSETIEGMQSTFPNVRDHDLSVYFKTQGSAMCLGGYEQNPEFIHGGMDDDFHFGLYDLDWDTFAQNLEGHIKRCPLIAETGIQSTVCGPESFTPDHKALIGPDPNVNGFFYAAGFNSMVSAFFTALRLRCTFADALLLFSFSLF